MVGSAVRTVSGLVAASALMLSATASQAAFNPPVVVRSMKSAQGRIYFIDRGQDANIKVGDILNVFRVVAMTRSPGGGGRHCGSSSAP
ncbi:hypothetical protein ACFL6X_04695 [Candidatus Latescibacterota bacterium]